MCGQPLAVPERDELVLSPVHQQNRNGDLGQPEPPRAELGAAVISPSLAAGRETLVSGVREMLGSAFQDGQVGGYSKDSSAWTRSLADAAKSISRSWPVLARAASGSSRYSRKSSTLSWPMPANQSSPSAPYGAGDASEVAAATRSGTARELAAVWVGSGGRPALNGHEDAHALGLVLGPVPASALRALARSPMRDGSRDPRPWSTQDHGTRRSVSRSDTRPRRGSRSRHR